MKQKWKSYSQLACQPSGQEIIYSNLYLGEGTRSRGVDGQQAGSNWYSRWGVKSIG